jgi:2-polyprenyl-6-methoxyphenol hydroxylase-like FAD-dependent oxidoreductase
VKVAIVGAGPAGLSLASLLAKRHRVTVLERAPQPTPVGAGVLLQPSGLQVLHDMGLLDQVQALGAPIERLYGTLKNGWPVMDMRYQSWRANSVGLGTSRHALTSVLMGRALQEGAQVQGDAEVHSLNGEQGLPEFDLTVVANGSFSHLREAASIASRSTPYPWGALWVLLRAPAGPLAPELRQWYRAANQMLGLMPTGFHSLAEKQAQQAPWVSLFWSVRADQVEALRAAPLADWKAQVVALAPCAQPYLDQIHRWEQLAWARYADVRTPCPWRGRVVCIGDAAHAMSPQLGQGSNMALIDAWVLAQCLHKAGNEVPAALHDYTRTRQRHLQCYQAASKWLTPMFQSSSVLMPMLRNVSFWPGSRMPGSSRLAATLLTGNLFFPPSGKL